MHEQGHAAQRGRSEVAHIGIWAFTTRQRRCQHEGRGGGHQSVLAGVACGDIRVASGVQWIHADEVMLLCRLHHLMMDSPTQCYDIMSWVYNGSYCTKTLVFWAMSTNNCEVHAVMMLCLTLHCSVAILLPRNAMFEFCKNAVAGNEIAAKQQFLVAWLDGCTSAFVHLQDALRFVLCGVIGK